MDAIKQFWGTQLFAVDGFKLTVGIVIIIVILYYLFFMRKG